MASKSLKIYAFSLLATLAVGAFAYNAGLFDRFGAERPAESSALTGADGTGGGEQGAGARPAPAGEKAEVGTPAEAPAEEKPDEEAAPAGNDDAAIAVVPPRFDVVRVEPDGNVVIAGSAATDAGVEVITGARVLGAAEANGEGDFVVVLDEALEPGDYTLVLRATSPDRTVAMSEETAIVSIPETASGEVLAIVDEPGKPSRLITVPENGDGPGAEEEVAAAPAEDAAPGEDEGSAGTVAGKPAEDEAGAGRVTAAVPPAGEEAKEEGQAVASAPEAAAPAVEAEKPAEPVVEPMIVVEAVEIEGDHVFVAGRADAGKVVRVYANKDLIGEAHVSEIGRFLVESAQGLAVGDYIIRADLLELGSAEVIARAAVPFEREPGESMAAVAPDLVTPADEAEKPADAGAVADEETAPDAASGEAAPVADGGGTGEPASAPEAVAEVAGEEEPARQPEDTAVAEEPAVAEAGTDAVAKVNEAAAGEETGEPEVAAADVPEAKSSDGDAAPAATEIPPAAAPSGETPAESRPADAVAVAAAGGDEPAEGGEAASPGEDAGTDGDAAMTAPKLETVPGSVIIRRGDTLWRISRRVYGKGIRYTTLYTANQDQIDDPDRIWPGQVFDVPAISQDGKAANLEAIADRLQPAEAGAGGR